MALTLANIRSKVRGHIDEPTEAYWTDVELNGLISDAEVDLWTKINQIRKDYFLANFTLSVVAGQFRYQTADGMPTDMSRIETIRTITSGFTDMIWTPGNPTTPEWVDGLRADTPVFNPYQQFYALRNVNTLDLSPLPQQALQASVDYIQQPTPMVADADTFLLPDAYLRYVQYQAAAVALSKGPVGDPAAWEAKADKAWRDIMLAMDTPRSEQGPDVVEGMFRETGW